MQGRQASIWGLLNHLRLTHPSAAAISSQPVGQQPVDRTLTSNEAACKLDRCSGAVAAASSNADAGGNTNYAQDMVSVGPHGTIRCTSPVQRSPRHTQQRQQPMQKGAGQTPCPYHDHQTITVSLVGQANLYSSPAGAVSPQRSHRSASPSKVKGTADHSCAADAYVRLVSVGSSVGTRRHDSMQCSDRSGAQQQHTAPVRCPEPAAASSSSRKAALAQLRMARRRQQQLYPADVEQRVSQKMCARKKQGSEAGWSSRKTQDKQQAFLSDAGQSHLKCECKCIKTCNSCSNMLQTLNRIPPRTMSRVSSLSKTETYSSNQLCCDWQQFITICTACAQTAASTHMCCYTVRTGKAVQPSCVCRTSGLGPQQGTERPAARHAAGGKLCRWSAAVSPCWLTRAQDSIWN